MLVANYNEKGMLSITSVLGQAGTTGQYAFRGDLVLKEGGLREGSERDRKPPEVVIHQAIVLAGNDKLLFVGGLIYALADLSLFFDKYQSDMTSDTVLLFYVEDIAENMKVAHAGLTLLLLPYPGGMVWNELLETLYLEKSDLKGQSAEEKVVTAYEAAKDFDTKTTAIGFDDALAQTIEVVKELSAGPV
ncbi:hypothetical protein [Methylomarinum vadi]|uniref:hypothetical protein n=1 Tax=Methylomarinum vadi TaxID=438855 RepID=UPI0004DF8BB7|nr:hypothetical protein [Methylomarinum vadi]